MPVARAQQLSRLAGPAASQSARSAAAGRGLHFEPLEQRVALDAGGLVGQYFHNEDFTGLAFERTEAVDFPWGTAAPAPGIDGDHFSVRWLGQVEPRYSETYTFRTVSDEGVRLWVDGQLIIDAWDGHAARVDAGTITLQAGQRYDIRLEYYEGTGTSQIRLQWTSARQPLEAIPAAQLHAPEAGLRGAYSDAIGGNESRLDATIDFVWPGSPITSVAADSFKATWTGYVRADFSEQYTFQTLSDDGIRVRVGDQLIIDNWTEHSTTADAGSITLEAGKWYDLRIEYFEAAVDAEIRFQWSSDRQTGAGVFETVPSASLRAGEHAPLYFTNPLGDGADPFVIRWQDSYLHVRSTGGSIYIDKADNLEDIHRSTDESVSRRAWTPPPGTSYSTMVWAPELHQIDGKWYIYVAAAANNNNATHRMFVLERDDPDPMGSYIFKGQLEPATDRWAIDGTVLEWNDQLYFIWSGWQGFSDGQQNLYIAEMSNPWTISGDRHLIATPTYSWERHGLPINEGPQILIHEGKLHIIYSASGYWTHQYSLGRLTYNGTGPLLSMSSWTKAPSPVFTRAGDIVGTGHASFTESPDGTESWIVYHAHHDRYNWQDDRDILIQPFTWFADGTPNFGTPIPKNTRIEVPSGTPDANRVLLEGDYNASGSVDQFDRDVWTAQFGQAIFPGVSADGAADGFIDGADFLAWQRQLGQKAPAVTLSSQHLEQASSQAVTAGLTAAEEAPWEPAVEPGSTPALLLDRRMQAASPWWLEVPTDNSRQPTRTAVVDEAFAGWPAPRPQQRSSQDERPAKELTLRRPAFDYSSPFESKQSPPSGSLAADGRSESFEPAIEAMLQPAD